MLREQIRQSRQFLFLTELEEPIIWDTENPQCYELQTVLYRNQEILQKECQTVGFRTIELLPDKGLLLNGRKLKLNGVCEHHDLGVSWCCISQKSYGEKISYSETDGCECGSAGA